MAIQPDKTLIEKLKALPNKTAEATMHSLPSLLIGSPDDSRINELAKKQTSPFIINGEGKKSFIVVVDPTKQKGFLWWKSFRQFLFKENRYTEIVEENKELSVDERSFLEQLP